MKKDILRRLPFLISLLLTIQLVLPSVGVFAASTSSTMLPPSNLSSQILTPGNVKLTWSSVYGANGYNVYSITEGQMQLLGYVTTVSYTLNNLAEGSYSYVVSTVAPDGESGPCAPVTVDIVYPDMTAPTNLTHSLQNGNDIVLNWGTAPNAQQYNLYQISADGQKALVTSTTARTYTVTNSPAGTYTYAVSATHSLYGESPLSTPLDIDLVYPIMTSPSGFVYTVTNGNDMNLKWNAATYANSYKLYQVINGEKVLKDTVAGKTSVTYTNQPAGDYIYELHSYSDRFGESPEGSELTVALNTVTMAAPGNFAYKVQNVNDIVLTWSAVSYATNYKIYQIIDGQPTLINTITGTTVTFSNQPAGDYVYEVRSYSDRFGESAETAQVSFTLGEVIMAAPANFVYKIQNLNDVVLTWNTTSNANNYKVYRIVDGQKTLISTVTGATVTYTNQPAGDYIYEIHSNSTRFGESVEGSQVSLSLGQVTMVPPADFSYKLQNTNDIVLTWSAAANANNYKVYQIINGQKTLKSTVTGTTITYVNQPAGDYVFEVYSSSTRFGDSAEGAHLSFTLGAVEMVPPGDLTNKLQNGNDIVLSWSAAANANTYKVYQIVNGQRTLKSTVSGTTVTYANLPAGDYIYEVHSVSTRFGESAEGSQTSLSLVFPSMQPPENLVHTINSATAFSLNWSPAAYATTYKVYQIVDGQKVLKSTVTGTTVTYSNMLSGEYTYQVYSVSSRFGESLQGSELTLTLSTHTMEAPLNPTYSFANINDITLKWTPVQYATNYRVYQVIDAQKVLKSTVTGTAVTYTNQAAGDYKFVVHSFSTQFGESPVGAEITLSLVHPVMAAPANFGYKIQNGNDVVLTWDAVQYANSYNVYELVDGQEIFKKSVTGLTVSFLNEQAGDHCYVIRSVSSRFGESLEGSQVAFTLELPVMQAPDNLTKSIANGNDITLKWNAATYATEYRIYQVIDGLAVLKKTLTATSWTFPKMAFGEYSYEVRSYSTRFGESKGNSISFTLSEQTMQPPANFTFNVTNFNDISFKWDVSDYATAYKVYQVIDGQLELKKTVTTTTAALTNVPDGDQVYEVRSFSDRFGESEVGSQVSVAIVYPTMLPPSNPAFTIVNGNDITLKWTAASNTNNYKVYEIVDGQKVLKSTLPGTTVTYTNQTAGKHQYEIHSISTRYGESEEGSPISFELVFPTMQAPANPLYTVANGNDFTLKWNAGTYATGYKVYQVVDGQKVLKKTQPGTSVTFVNMPEGNYVYEIHSYSDRFGESPAGGVLNFNLEWPDLQPPELQATVVNANNITFTWPTAAWANEYRLYEMTDGTESLLYKGTGKTFKVYNLSEGKHDYELRIYNTRFGESESSSRLSEEIVYPIMEPPVPILTVLDNTSANIYWNFVTYANGYNIYELVDGKPVLLVANINNLSYKLTDLTYANHEYYVTSYSNSFGESKFSNIVRAKLIIDTTAPVTTAEAPTDWINEDAIVKFTATDDVTGVKETYFSINDGAYTPGTSLTVTEEGTTKISFYSVDNVGNTETEQTISVYVDKTAPVTRTSDIPDLSKSAVIELSATDAVSGIAKTFYSINDADYVEGTSVTVEKEGLNRVSFYSVDAAGNTEKAQTVEVKIDGTAPVTTSNAGQGWTKEDVAVILSATDEQSGVAKTFYSINGADYVEGTVFTVDKEGINQVSFYSVDAAGNTEKTQTVQVKIDHAAPVTSSNISEEWTSNEVTVRLSATDEQSGVAKTFYSTNRSEYVEGTTFTIDQDGITQVSFYSVDELGNKEEVQTAKVRIDKVAPVTSANVAEGWSDEDVTVPLIATDEHSGVLKTLYSVDGSDYTEGISVTIREEGNHNISFYSIDAAGNTEVAHTAVVKIDKSAPVLTMNLDAQSKLGSMVELKYTAIDELSGVMSDKMTVMKPDSTETTLVNGSSLTLDKPGGYIITISATNVAGLTTTITKHIEVYIPVSMMVAGGVINADKGIFAVHVKLPVGLSPKGFDLSTVTLNGVKALNNQKSYSVLAKAGIFMFESSDFDWKAPELKLIFSGKVNSYSVMGQANVKMRKISNSRSEFQVYIDSKWEEEARRVKYDSLWEKH